MTVIWSLLGPCRSVLLQCAMASRNSDSAALSLPSPFCPQALVAVSRLARALRGAHRSRRALLTHRAPALDGDEEPLFWPRMQDAWERQIPVSDRLHSRPRKSTSLASTHQRAMPTVDHVMAEC